MRKQHIKLIIMFFTLLYSSHMNIIVNSHGFICYSIKTLVKNKNIYILKYQRYCEMKHKKS